jgi:hypothetical protein
VFAVETYRSLGRVHGKVENVQLNQIIYGSSLFRINHEAAQAASNARRNERAQDLLETPENLSRKFGQRRERDATGNNPRDKSSGKVCSGGESLSSSPKVVKLCDLFLQGRHNSTLLERLFQPPRPRLARRAANASEDQLVEHDSKGPNICEAMEFAAAHTQTTSTIQSKEKSW